MGSVGQKHLHSKCFGLTCWGQCSGQSASEALRRALRAAHQPNLGVLGLHGFVHDADDVARERVGVGLLLHPLCELLQYQRGIQAKPNQVARKIPEGDAQGTDDPASIDIVYPSLYTIAISIAIKRRLPMNRRYSIAEARHNLAAVVHELEQQPTIELTRRGETVAVLLSLEEYQRLQGRQRDFWSAYTAFREQFAQDDTDIADLLREARDASPGREVVL